MDEMMIAETLTDGRNEETRKRSGASLDQTNPPSQVGGTLPPNFVGLCKPYHCGICKVGLNSLLISTAHYAGAPHANNVDWEWQIFNNGGKIPNKRKKLDNKLLKSGKTKEKNSFHCDVCKLDLEGEEQFKAHIFGKSHKKKLESVKKLEGKVDSVKKVEPMKCFFCEVCKIDLQSESSFKSHQLGKNHKRKIILENMNSFSCEVCKIDLTSAIMLKTHQMGKNHKKKLNEVAKIENLITSGPAGKAESKKSLSCDVCDIVVNCEESLRSHILGKSHKKKLQKVVKEQNADSSNKTLITSDPIVQNLVNQTGIDATVSATPSNVSIPSNVLTSPSLMSETAFTDASAVESSVNQAVMGKNNISALTELAVKNGYLLQWTLVSHQIGPPQVFTMQVQIGEHTSQGTGSSKKLAKNAAAEQMMNILPEEWQQAASKGMSKKSKNKSKNVRLKTDEKEFQSPKSKKIKLNTNFSCELCGLASLSSVTLQAHLIGKTHLKNTKRKGYSTQNNEEIGAKVTQIPEASETAVFKEVDDGENKHVPDLTDSVMCNLIRPDDLIKNNELKITLKLNDNNPHHAKSASKKGDIVLKTENTVDDKLEDADSSDDDLIILENPDNLSSKQFMENTQNLNKAPILESVKLCVYPLGQSESVTVTTQDYATLAYDTYLNDIIIDFYLLYLSNNVLSNSDKEKVHIFSTMFYKRLMQSPSADAKKVPEYENDARLTSAEKRHCRVASWTKNVDLFEKDLLIIPICEESHWYLLLVVKPGIIFFPFEMKEKGDPFMIVLDSVGGRKNMAVKNIRRYLACEWNKKKCDGTETLVRLEQMGKKMNTLRPDKPEQENNSDCGIFLLQYVDKVFQNVASFLWPFLVNSRTREWFTSQEVAGKRGEIAQLIKRLTKEQKPGEVIEYPDIKFTENGV